MNLSYGSILEFITLLALEMILGIDNLIFIIMITKKLPPRTQNKVRICGIGVALLARFAMVFQASSLLSMNTKVFSFHGIGCSYRDIFMILGGVFLIYKSVKEIYFEIFPREPSDKSNKQVSGSIFPAIIQITWIDLMLSLDSVISAVGITEEVSTICVVFFIYSISAIFLSQSLATFIHKNDNIKIIALLFIGALGFLLTLDGFSVKISHNYLYAMLLFTGVVEAVKMLKQRSARE